MRITSILKNAGIECISSECINLDVRRFAEYQDSDEHPAQDLFECPVPKSPRIQINEFGQGIVDPIVKTTDGRK
jgi:hypothetical protein